MNFICNFCKEMPSETGMSKRTSYSKIYRLDFLFVRTSSSVVRTSARVRVYPADKLILSRSLPSPPFPPPVPSPPPLLRTQSAVRTEARKK
jgi:hypothetical protein